MSKWHTKCEIHLMNCLESYSISGIYLYLFWVCVFWRTNFRHFDHSKSSLQSYIQPNERINDSINKNIWCITTKRWVIIAFQIIERQDYLFMHKTIHRTFLQSICVRYISQKVRNWKKIFDLFFCFFSFLQIHRLVEEINFTSTEDENLHFSLHQILECSLEHCKCVTCIEVNEVFFLS